MSAQAYEAIRQWGAARLALRTVRHARERLGGCEFYDPYEWETGSPGQPRCIGSVAHRADMCDTCAAKDVMFPAARALKLEARRHRNRVQRAAERIAWKLA